MRTNKKNKREIAQSEALDKTAKIVSGLVPGGASVYELFTAIVTPLHVKRKEEWVREVTMRLHKLETDGIINLEELSRNEEFNTVITKATLIAQQTHQKEKIEALRNVVVNVAEKISDTVAEFDLTDYYLSILEQINPLQIQLLTFFRNPELIAQQKEISLDQFVKSAKIMPGNELRYLIFKIYPELKPKESLIIFCWAELQRFGLVKGISLTQILNHIDIIRPQTTKFGNQFLKIIENQ